MLANICHDGKADAGKGTYKVHVRHRATEQWYQIQDLIVEEILPQMIFMSESYIQASVSFIEGSFDGIKRVFLYRFGKEKHRQVRVIWQDIRLLVFRHHEYQIPKTIKLNSVLLFVLEKKKAYSVDTDCVLKI